eukprot:253619-Rhodomonas_salina.2
MVLREVSGTERAYGGTGVLHGCGPRNAAQVPYPATESYALSGTHIAYAAVRGMQYAYLPTPALRAVRYQHSVLCYESATECPVLREGACGIGMTWYSAGALLASRPLVPSPYAPTPPLVLIQAVLYEYRMRLCSYGVFCTDAVSMLLRHLWY